MGLIPEPVIEDVLERSDIVDTVRHYVNLDKSGKNWKGLCPFHDDHDPSLKVHREKGIYKCFACGAGGNAIGFVMEMEGWSFPEAVRHLAERNGVEIPDQDPEEAERARKRRERKQRYFEIMDRAREFYESKLWTDPGVEARRYLADRGLDEETARDFGLGYAPEGWQNVLDHLRKLGFEADEIAEAGLALERNSGSGHYDRFRHRIVFPVVDIWRKTRAFGGRTLETDDDTPKYINSPETDFYEKGEELYGLHVAKQHFNDVDYALIVEGNFDVLVLHAMGFPTAVAPMGTALTEDQADLLSRYTQRVVVAFDGDEAGRKASQRCIPSLQAAGLEGRVVRFDVDDDPDSFVRREGSEALEDKIEEADPLVGWALDRVLEPAVGDDVERKLTALEQVGAILDEIENRVAWNHYAQDVSRQLSIEPDLLHDYLERPRQHRDEAEEALEATNEPLELDPTEFKVLVLLLKKPERLESFLDQDYDTFLESELLASCLGRLHEHYRKHDALDPALLLEEIEDPRFRQTILDALEPGEPIGEDEREQNAVYRDCIRALKRRWVERTLTYLEQRFERIDFERDTEEKERLREQWRQVSRVKASLD